MKIRSCVPEDAEALAKIYAPYVDHTAISFELVAPEADEFRGRIIHTLQKFPYIVAEIDGEIWYNTTDLSCSRVDGYFYKDNKTSYTSGDDDSSLRKVLNWEDWICIFLCNEYGWAKVIRKSGE
mgnify:CR=1 FL=1